MTVSIKSKEQKLAMQIRACPWNYGGSFERLLAESLKHLVDQLIVIKH